MYYIGYTPYFSSISLIYVVLSEIGFSIGFKVAEDVSRSYIAIQSMIPICLMFSSAINGSKLIFNPMRFPSNYVGKQTDIFISLSCTLFY